MAEEIKAVETNEIVLTEDNDSQASNEVTATTSEQPTSEVVKEAVKTEQSKEDNSKFARLRREKEEAERLENAKNEARTQAIIEAIGENPYTHKPLLDAKDVEAYLIMKQIDKDGGEPLTDYAEYQKKSEIKKEEKVKATKDAETNRINDIKDFVSKHPEVNLDELGKDADFEEYCGDRLGVKPLNELYESYQKFLTRIGEKKEQDAKEQQVREVAKKNASAGSLDSTASAEEDIYSIEELKKLSMEELEKNWTKVERSRKKYNI